MLPVLTKVPAIFEYRRDETGKPVGTRDKVAVNPSTEFRVTAKMDGTCCYIKDGQIYARQDVKKSVDNAPPDWFPTDGIEPDRNGLIMGFRPLDKKRGDKWHLAALDVEDPTKARFLEYDPETQEYFYVTRRISDFNGKTAELMGPSVNKNTHHLEKHAYIVHGLVEVSAPWNSYEGMKEWLNTEGRIYEGIVIHDVGNNQMYKCHRGHLGGSMMWEGYPLPVKNS